ncbi:hypothetical protein BJ508DRAFT_417656 [Ascobolus immersus RN42]|uniref:Uncharacterized protein n=1 Tax=Ascobolus immersus RN42 TaxID=1160509 RepID=A0A3N4HR32_ASCIM|nr:hypothetical protein BJ508DRAFT_417656 [Ascobolus immersus RN42]
MAPSEKRAKEPTIKLEDTAVKSESDDVLPGMSSQEVREVRREIFLEASAREIHYRTSYNNTFRVSKTTCRRPVVASTLISNMMRKRDKDAAKQMEEWRMRKIEEALENEIGTITMQDKGVWVCELDDQKWEVLYGKGNVGDWSHDAELNAAREVVGNQ